MDSLTPSRELALTDTIFPYQDQAPPFRQDDRVRRWRAVSSPPLLVLLILLMGGGITAVVVVMLAVVVVVVLRPVVDNLAIGLALLQQPCSSCGDSRC